MEWQGEDQFKEQWEENEKMENILEQKKVDGGAWQVYTLQQLQELISQKRMSQFQKTKGSEGKKKCERMVY